MILGLGCKVGLLFHLQCMVIISGRFLAPFGKLILKDSMLGLIAKLAEHNLALQDLLALQRLLQ